jgi:hypothetical protein
MRSAQAEQHPHVGVFFNSIVDCWAAAANGVKKTDAPIEIITPLRHALRHFTRFLATGLSSLLSALPGRRSFLSVIVSLLGVTMNRKVSLTQSPQSVP